MIDRKLGAVLIAIAATTAAPHSSSAQDGGDKVPAFDMEPTCRDAVSAKLDLVDAPTFDACMQQEGTARQALEAQWSTFPAGDRRVCTEAIQTGGPPSYVEMLGCLQDAQLGHKLDQTTP